MQAFIYGGYPHGRGVCQTQAGATFGDVQGCTVCRHIMDGNMAVIYMDVWYAAKSGR
ncbi:hypothetical protein [Thalassotalea agarivorans]|uniref:hypothetical protein n=1 Tax=Thalassotalea agarivorans TaxID=349064 RepID=UPI0015A56AE7|nr:hypothetical protein [Thalassotalea agarivorans]